LDSDEDLAHAYGAGDDRALSTLYDRYRRPLYVFCARVLGEPHAAHDAVQDVFLAACQRREEFARLLSVRAWLFTVGRNRCLTVLRRARPQVALPGELESRGEAPSDALQADEELRLVRRALGEIQPELREVVVLREYLELSYREIAGIVGATEGAVKSRLFKARRALHTNLKPAFFEGDEPCSAKSSSSS
jgi:RNA polymerase sigma-70 factor, ECF subfamily